MKKTLQFIVFSLMCSITSISVANNEAGAKALFSDGTSMVSTDYGEETNDVSEPKRVAKTKIINRSTSVAKAAKVAKSENIFMGVSYSVELERNGKSKIVTTSYPFISGDRIQLRLKTNRDGYLYVNTEGTTGRIQRLFPSNNQDVLIKAGTPISIPSTQMMHFDDNPGKEKLWVTLSAIPLGSLQNTPANTQNNYKESSFSPEGSPVSGQTIAYTGCGSKDLLLEGGEGDMNQVRQQCGAKDLVIEDDTSGNQPSSYVVAPVSTLMRDAPIILPITLTHK